MSDGTGASVALVPTTKPDPKRVAQLKASINRVSAQIKAREENDVAEDEEGETPKLHLPRGKGYGDILTEPVMREIHQRFIVEENRSVAWLAENNGYVQVSYATMLNYLQKYDLPYGLSLQEWQKVRNYREAFMARKVQKDEETTVADYSMLTELMRLHLPEEGVWTRERRDRFVAAYTAVLDLLVEVTDGEDAGNL